VTWYDVFRNRRDRCQEKRPHLGLALLVIATAQLMVVLDATVVNVALRAFRRARILRSGLEWVVNAYALAFGGLLLLAAGPVTCSAGGGCSSSACCCSRRVPRWRARHLTGVAAGGPGRSGRGAAIVAPTALALIATTFPPGPPAIGDGRVRRDERGRRAAG